MHAPHGLSSFLLQLEVTLHVSNILDFILLRGNSFSLFRLDPYKWQGTPHYCTLPMSEFKNETLRQYLLIKRRAATIIPCPGRPTHRPRFDTNMSFSEVIECFILTNAPTVDSRREPRTCKTKTNSWKRFNVNTTESTCFHATSIMAWHYKLFGQTIFFPLRFTRRAIITPGLLAVG